ncbi:MAG: hypothetical protein QOF45_2488 [Gaiellaceae bacterium]|jgi:hypothetical protein|nr:hypothetical protein [Gaiellaceae bacterium]
MLVLIAAIVAIEMIPVRLTVERAWWIFGIGAVAPVVLGALFGLRRSAAGLPVLGRSVRLTDAVLVRFRHVGLPLLGLAFFVFWTLLYTGLWAASPHEAFGGVSDRPRLADFFYYAVSTAFTSPPEGISAGSRGVRSATMIELFTALALISVYLSSFVDWQRTRAREDTG